MKKYISTTLPYINSQAHAGHAWEWVIADLVAEFYRMKLGKENVWLNVGIDEHGTKVAQAAELDGCDPKEFCDRAATRWMAFCILLDINYDSFYRTTSQSHKFHVRKFYNEIKQHTYTKEYNGNYCIGCEAYVTDKEAVNGMCPIHKQALIPQSETNVFLDLIKFAPQIKNVLVDKSISAELENLLKEPFDLSITRQNVKWGIPTGEGDSVFYCWFEALTNYIFAIDYYEEPERFKEFWESSLIICGKDNLKFQAYILQAMLLANGIPQTKEVLVHGMILDSKGVKMSKSLGNVIDPVEQIRRYGLDAVRYYLAFGLNTFGDSKYSEGDLKTLWNADIVDGLGNLIARLLHLIDIRDVDISETKVSGYRWDRIYYTQYKVDVAFCHYDFKGVRDLLNGTIARLNKTINDSKPFSKDCVNYAEILNEIYFELTGILPYYKLILKRHDYALDTAFAGMKKAIVFKKLE